MWRFRLFTRENMYDIPIFIRTVAQSIAMLLVVIITLAGCGPFQPHIVQPIVQPIVQLTKDPADDIEPAWSPDGSHIVFLSNRVNPEDGFDLFMIAVNGTNERLIAQFTVTDPWGGRFSNPAWLAGTGDMLVIDHKYYWEVLRFHLSAVKDFPVRRDVWDGDSPFFTRLLFVPGGQGASSAVSSGGKLVWAALIDNWAYVPPERRRYVVRLYEGSLNTFIGNTDSVGQVVFETEPGGFIEGPGSVAFSPDGTEICISAALNDWTKGKGRDIYVVNLITGEVRRLTRTGEDGMDNSNVTWSRNNEIAFSSGPKDGGQRDLYLIKPDGTGLRRLTSTPYNEIMPSWSPDGTKLAFVSDMNGNYDVYIMSVPY